MDVGRIIKGLECCRRGFCFACPYNDGVDDNVDCKQILADDVLALLKAQQPRVLTLEEAASCDACWFEVKENNGLKYWPYNSKINRYVLRRDCMDDKDIVFEGNFDFYIRVVSHRYGKAWRCWSARPTDEQREAVKWDE